MQNNIFGLPIKYEDWNHHDSLPLYITGSYNFCNAFIANTRFIMLTPTEELPTLPALKKHILRIQSIDSVPVALNLSAVSTYRRNSLLENNIPFVTQRQAYLPFMGAILMDEKKPETRIERFVFSTQQLFLLYLYSNKKSLYVSEAGKKLPFTAMTLTRAVKQLEATDLFVVTKDGVNKVIESKFSPLELYGRAKPYLSNPIYREGYIDRSLVTKDMLFAGETALAEKTMLNPSRVDTYAIYKKNYDASLLTEELIYPDQQVHLELWAYDPKQFSKDNCTDDISLALSFENTADERIEAAIENLVEERLGK